MADQLVIPSNTISRIISSRDRSCPDPANSYSPARSFAPKKADSPGESPAVVNAVGKEVGRVVVIVDENPVFPAGHVVETPANSPVVAQSVESLFNVCV